MASPVECDPPSSYAPVTLAHRHVVAVVAGNALEFYDFLCFAFFATQIGHSFFPSSGAEKSLLLTLATFGVGFATRPLGAFFIGRMADTVGRRPAMILSFALMGGSILGLALTPSYAAIGVAAPILVVCFRLTQGFALGGEVGSATVFLAEAAPARHRGFYVSLQAATSDFSVLCAGLVGVILSALLSPEALDAWGWRVAFLLGVAVVPLGLVARRSVPETLRREPRPADGADAAPARLGRIALLGLMMLGASTIGSYVADYMTTFAINTLHMPAGIAFGATVVVGLSSMPCEVIAGVLSDRYGRRPVMLVAGAALLITIYPAFLLITHSRTLGVLYGATAVLGGLQALSSTPILVWLSEAFPQRIRSRALATTYAVAIATFGGTTQFMLTWLLSATGNDLAPAWYWFAALSIGLAAVWFTHETAPARTLPAIGIVLVLLGIHSASAGQQRITAAELQKPSWSGGLVPNTEFVPAAGAAEAHEPFIGTLRLAEIEMTTDPAQFKSRSVLGRDPKLFPAVDLTFFTSGRELVPVTQEVIRAGSAGQGRSFWDFVVQPGEIWSESQDDGWSRAAFPFALVNSIEGETHNGLATFLYKGNVVSNLRFQIVQQTAPFEVADLFTASGSVPAVFVPAAIEHLDQLTSVFHASVANRVPVVGWDKLASQFGAELLAGFDSAMPAKDVVLAGLDYRGAFYLEQCNSAAGPLPWCDRARFGVWSATKALANETALLRLAQRYGDTVFDLKLADFVPALAGRPGWNKVTFEDAIDMATGMGNGSAKRDPNDILDGYLDPGYTAWYEARSKDDKLAALVKTAGVYPWEPGQVARYRDQDMFLLGVAMDGFLKAKEGPQADLWSMLETEVFTPIGIRYAPVNRTIEPDGALGQPLMAFGYYATIGDMVKIARLYQAEGRFDRDQILYAPRLKELAAGPTPRGLPTGEQLPYGETRYINAFWRAAYDSPEGCTIYYPRMVGWGGNLVALFPGGLTGIRLAKSADATNKDTADTSGMARVANRLVTFCP